eukprot:gene18023-biopygen5216
MTWIVSTDVLQLGVDGLKDTDYILVRIGGLAVQGTDSLNESLHTCTFTHWVRKYRSLIGYFRISNWGMFEENSNTAQLEFQKYPIKDRYFRIQFYCHPGPVALRKGKLQTSFLTLFLLMQVLVKTAGWCVLFVSGEHCVRYWSKAESVHCGYLGTEVAIVSESPKRAGSVGSAHRRALVELINMQNAPDEQSKPDGARDQMRVRIEHPPREVSSSENGHCDGGIDA